MALQRVVWRGITTDKDTADALEYLATELSGDVLIDALQGSYTSNTDASAGTHDRGGVIDLLCTPTTGPLIEKWLRSIGFAAWYRAERRRADGSIIWRHHVHAIRLDCPELSTDAITQKQDYLAGYNGLPIGGRINKDTGSREYLDVRWLVYKETEMTLSTEDKAWIKATIETVVWDDKQNHPLHSKDNPLAPVSARSNLQWAARYALLGLNKLGGTDFVDEKAVAAAIIPVIAPAVRSALGEIIEPVPGEVNVDALADAFLAKLAETLAKPTVDPTNG